MIEPPEEFIPADFSPKSVTRWNFPTSSAAELDALWQRAGLGAAEREILNATSIRVPAARGITLEPPPDLVLGLTPAARAAIYIELGRHTENPAHRDPFRFRADLIEDWFHGSDLAPEVVARTKQLLYPRHHSLLFSDHEIVLPHISDVDQRIRFLKTLSRKSALLVRLRVAPDADVEGLARYWTHGRRAKDAKPLLASLARQPNGGVIDIVHLLPPFARALLNTYPEPGDAAVDALRDCHWTSFNFYKATPDDRYTDINVVRQTLLQDYYPVSGASALGDIVMLVQADGVVVHSCVYIADEIVFTKNGPAYSVPWLLGRLDNVVAFYSVGEGPLEIRRYRAKQR